MKRMVHSPRPSCVKEKNEMETLFIFFLIYAAFDMLFGVSEGKPMKYNEAPREELEWPIGD